MFPKVVVKDLAQFPIPRDRTQQEGMILLVQSMSALHKELAVSKNAQPVIIQRQIESTNPEINQLVYRLYNLEDHEIEPVENSGPALSATVA
jgi:D-ribose pyranose/furanose isomerase RbsD